MSMCRVISCVVGRVFAMTSIFSWYNSVSLCLASFCTPRPNLPVTSIIPWLPTFAFQLPVMKTTSFLGVSSRRCCSLQLFSHVRLFVTHGLQHTELPCPSPTTRAYSNSCPSSQWCHPTISFSVIPFSSSLQSFPASGSFPMHQFFISGGRNIGVSASASVLPMNIQDWFPLGLTGWIFLLSKGLKSLLQHHSSKASILRCWAFLIVQLLHP